MVDICEYELPTSLQNFTQKDLTEVKIFRKVLGGGTFFWNTLYAPNNLHWVGCSLLPESLMSVGFVVDILIAKSTVCTVRCA